jgi:hypothetical protein
VQGLLSLQFVVAQEITHWELLHTLPPPHAVPLAALA